MQAAVESHNSVTLYASNFPVLFRTPMVDYFRSLLLSRTPFSHRDKKEHVTLVPAVTNGGPKWFYLVLSYTH